jgi:NADH-quinone oxidoreductase subunit G/NADP-reducing hydrogenase subunit HndD
MVEREGSPALERSCVTVAVDGDRVRTNTARALEARRTAVELMLANHPDDCLSCVRSDACELRALATRVGARSGRFPRVRSEPPPASRDRPISLDPRLCVLCGRCVSVCRDLQGVSALDFAGRGQQARVSTFFDRPLSGSDCVECGQCALVCPTAAIVERDDAGLAWAAIHDRSCVVAAQVAPAVRASLGKALGLATSSADPGLIAAALRRLGFDLVFDSRFAADVVAAEERAELAERMAMGGALPMFSSCSPSWVRYVERHRPEARPHLSTCKSPQQVLGALAKTRYARDAGIDPGKLKVVSIMPCVAKKAEAARSDGRAAAAWWRGELGDDRGDFPDVDIVLTARELSRMLKEAGIDASRLDPEPFDPPFDESSGASALFGASGGVALAVAREHEFRQDHAPFPRIAAANGLREASATLEAVAAGIAPYDFVEVMACPGGCVAGGGQLSRVDAGAALEMTGELSRADAESGSGAPGANRRLEELYREFLGVPLSPLAVKLLHVQRA